MYSVNVSLDCQLRFLSFEITFRASNNRWCRLQFYLNTDCSMIIILDVFIARMDNKEVSIVHFEVNITFLDWICVYVYCTELSNTKTLLQNC